MLVQHFSHSTGPEQSHGSVQNKVYHHLRLLPLSHPLSDSKHPDGREQVVELVTWRIKKIYICLNPIQKK